MSSFDLASSNGSVDSNSSSVLSTANSGNPLSHSSSLSSSSSGGNITMTLEQEFELLLDKLGIQDEAKRKGMMAMPDANKKMLIDQNKTDIYKTVKSKGRVESFADVKSVIASINTKTLTIDVIKSLRVQLATAPVDWIQSFLNLDGVQPILDILIKMDKKKQTRKRKDLAILQFECIRCIAAIMKIKIGMEYVASYPACTNQLMLSIDSPLIKVKTLALELLAAIAIIPKGHGAVLTSIIYYKEAKKEEARYYTLVQSLKLETNIDYLTTCISFINCIISSPGEVSSRIEIRKSFLNQKILKYFENLRRDHAECKLLITQLDVFEEEMTNDEQINATQTTQGVSMEELFSQVSARVNATPSQAELITLLNHFQKMASSTLGLRVWKYYNQLASELEDELASNPDLDIGQIHLAFPELKKAGFLSSLGGKKSPSVSPSLSSSGAKTELDRAKLKKDNEEKQKTIEHLLKQLNSFTGGQDISKWINEREEKNKMIASLMQQSRSAEGFAENETLKRELDNLKLELDNVKNTPLMNNNNIQSINNTMPTLSISSTPQENTSIENTTTTSTDNPSIPADGSPPPPGGPPPPPPPPGGGPPPPPPPPGGPPPPPPPPGSGPPPPPPPGMKKLARPAKAIIKPSVKMRNFNWVTLPAVKIENTFWDKVDETSVIQSIDRNELEGLFSAKAAAPKPETIKSPKKQVVNLIDMKKSNNCAIMLQNFKIPNAEFKRIMQQMDEKVLDLHNTQYLLQFVPTKEEMETLRDYQGDVSQLGAAEQFMMAIMDVPKLEARLRAHLFKLKLSSFLEDMVPDIKAVKTASMEIKTSKRLHEILRYVLGIGNYVNGSTTRGGAHGFKIDTLSKLRDAKSNDNKFSLLHFLAKTINDKNPDLWSVTSEVTHVEHAGEVSINNIIQDFSEMRKGIDLIEREFNPPALTSSMSAEGTTSPPPPQPVANDAFSKSIVQFLSTAKNEYAKLDKAIEEMNKQYESVTSFFGESKTTCPPEVFFVAFTNFLEDLEKAWKEYQTLIKKEKDTKYEDPEKGGLEDLTSHIRSGQLFKERRKSSNLTNVIAEKVLLASASLKPTAKNPPSSSLPPQPKVALPTQSMLKPASDRKLAPTKK